VQEGAALAFPPAALNLNEALRVGFDFADSLPFDFARVFADITETPMSEPFPGPRDLDHFWRANLISASLTKDRRTLVSVTLLARSPPGSLRFAPSSLRRTFRLLLGSGCAQRDAGGDFVNS
jgi:hypothetical protein